MCGGCTEDPLSGRKAHAIDLMQCHRKVKVGLFGQGKKVLIVTGEASGDLHAGSLVFALKEEEPSISIYGVGSERMREAGAEILQDSKEIAIVGFVEVIPKIFKIYMLLKRLRRFMMREKPDLLILVDFPDFNLRLAKRAKKLNIPVLYYISPQIWAWREGRARKIVRLVDRMAVIFPFEKAYYEREGLSVEFVGHPLIDTVRKDMLKDDALRSFGLDPEGMIIGLLPGSRKSEIRKILPQMIGAAREIKKAFPMVQFAIPLAPTVEEDDLIPFIENSGMDIKVLRNFTYDLIHSSMLVVVASGTATLEAAILGKPMVVVYRTSWFNYIIGKILVKVRDIAMVNIVAGKRIVPELIQSEANPDRISQEVISLIKDKDRYRMIEDALERVRNGLGGGGASKRVAGIAMEMMRT